MLPAILLAAALAAPPDADTVWPAVVETDFKLKVELVVPGIKDAKGVLQLANKSVLSVRLKAEKACDAAVYWIDPKGDVVQLFPNRFDRDGRLKAGEERTVPPAGKEYELETTPTEGDGVERLRVVAVTGAMPASPAGENAGPYTVYRSEAARKAVVRSVRGVLVREKPGVVPADAVKVAHTELRFRVGP